MPHPRAQKEIIIWLDRYKWTHFVTLALNDPEIRVERAREIVKQWDARINRRLYGPKWDKKPDERLFAFYFFEKPRTNPHWHALIMLDDPDLTRRAQQARTLDNFSEVILNRLQHRGTAVVQEVDHRLGACRYVAKELRREVQYGEFVLFREFE